MLTTLETARAALEAVRNTPLAPTRKLYFDTATHNQEVGTIRPRELRASYFPVYRSYPGIERNGFEFGGGVTFQDLPWWLNLHVKALGAGTPGAGGDAAAITWDFAPSAAVDDLKSACVQYGAMDGPIFWEVPGLLGEELTLTFKKGEDLKFSSKLLTAKGATQIVALTGVGPDRATVSALGSTTKVFIDTAAIGATEDDVEEATFKLTNGFVHRDSLDGTRVAKEVKRPKPREWELEVQRYFSTKAELDAYLAKTKRKVRVRTEGDLVPGAAAAKYKVDVECYGVWDKHAWARVDDMIYARMTLVPEYDETAASDFKLAVVNNIATAT